jgi:hypothetical protein
MEVHALSLILMHSNVYVPLVMQGKTASREYVSFALKKLLKIKSLYLC